MHDEGAYGCDVGSTARHEPDIETEAPAKIYHDHRACSERLMIQLGSLNGGKDSDPKLAIIKITMVQK